MGDDPNTPTEVRDSTRRPRKPVKLPNFADCETLQIDGDAMFPRYHDGDVLFHDPMDYLRGVPPRLHGRECVVHLPDGQRMVRTLVHEGDGHYTLLGHQVPPVIRQQVLAASPIRGMIRPLDD